jgi:hypothetical protein
MVARITLYMEFLAKTRVELPPVWVNLGKIRSLR